MVPEKVMEIIAKRKWEASPANLKSDAPLYHFKDEEMQRIAKFLINHHYPLVEEKRQQKGDTLSGSIARPPVPPVPVLPPVPATIPVQISPPIPPPLPPAAQAVPDLGLCDKCGAQCEIQWGRFSYYWKCPACANNMAIKEFCPGCKGKMKIRKDKAKYFIGCDPCRTEHLYCEFE